MVEQITLVKSEWIAALRHRAVSVKAILSNSIVHFINVSTTVEYSNTVIKIGKIIILLKYLNIQLDGSENNFVGLSK